MEAKGCVHCYITITLPLHDHYITVTLPLHYHYTTVTLLLHYHHITVTLPLHYHYTTVTLQLHYCYTTVTPPAAALGLVARSTCLGLRGGGERVHGRGVSHSPARARAAFTWRTSWRDLLSARE